MIYTIDDDTVTASGFCQVTGEHYEVVITLAEYELWRSGVPIQKAMPTRDPDTREWLLSQISPKGWDEMFSGADANDDADAEPPQDNDAWSGGFADNQ